MESGTKPGDLRPIGKSPGREGCKADREEHIQEEKVVGYRACFKGLKGWVSSLLRTVPHSEKQSRRQAGEGTGKLPPSPVNHSVLGDEQRYPLSLSALQLCESLTNEASERYKKEILTSPCKNRITLLGLSRLHLPNSILYPQSHHCLAFSGISYTFFLCI